MDKKSVPATTQEIAEILWEGVPYDFKIKNAATAAISSLKKDLAKAGVDGDGRWVEGQQNI